MEFKAKMVNGKPVIQPIIKKDKKGNVTVHVPSLELINKFTQEQDEKTQ